LDLVAFDPDAHCLTVHFQGSCDSCAGSTGGTMYALEGILRAEYDPNITIHVENEYAGVW
jgi:Fe-S cluster biogenesis protein NfuA